MSNALSLLHMVVEIGQHSAVEDRESSIVLPISQCHRIGRL